MQDDGKVIEGDREMNKASALVAVWTRPYYYMENEKSVYRPVTSFSFYLNALITGKEAWGFRLGNVLLYGWVSGMVYRILKELQDSRNLPRGKAGQGIKTGKENIKSKSWGGMAFWGAVLFTVLPIHTEVVNNIVGRAEILSLGFALLAVLKVFDRKWELGALFLFLAMLSKETAMVGVPIVIHLIWSNREVKNGEKWGAGFLAGMALVGFLLLRTVILGGVGTGNNATMVENPLKFVTAEKRVMNAIALIPFGVGKILFPVNLSYDYSYNQIRLVDSWLDWRVLVGALMAILSGIYLYRFRIKSEMTMKIGNGTRADLQGQALQVVGMMTFWGPILITGNILFPIGTIFGERLWFWPSLGVLLVITSWFEVCKMTYSTSFPRVRGWIRSVRHFACPSAPLAVITILLIFYTGRTWVRNLDWLSQERLFLHDAEYASHSVMAQSNAAAMYMIQHNLIPAREKMEKASEIYPKYPELLNNWGLYYLWTGKKEEAKKKFEECLSERKGFYLCQGNLKLVDEKE